MRAADLLIQTLQTLGVKYIFSLSGNQVMPIYDACIGSEVKIIHVRHESAAVHMADAWGRLTGQPGVALIAGGPGFANSLSATYVAQMAESPVVVLSGHAPLSTAGRMAFQEMDQITPALSVSKNAFMIKKPETIGAEVAWGFKIAAEGRPGPVHISLPQDLLSAKVDESNIAGFPPNDFKFAPNLPKGLIDRIKKSLQDAKRPLLLVGPGALRNRSFKKHKAQLAKSGLALIGMESPRGIDDPATGTFGELIAQADLLVLLGKKLDFTLKYGDAPYIKPNTKIIQIDFDQTVLNLTKHNSGNVDLVELTAGDPIAVIDRLAKAKIEGLVDDFFWLKTVEGAIDYRPTKWESVTGGAGKLHPAQVGQAINGHLADAKESIFISDGGAFGQWMQSLVKSTHRIINGKSGSIGNAIPFALAARLAYPNAKIVAACGDGAFGFTPFEFDTAVRYDIPFTLVIGNDSYWGAEYHIQLENYGKDRVFETGLNDTRYDQVVQILGGWGVRPADIAEFETALLAAELSALPACINVPIDSVSAPKLVSVKR